MPRGDYQLWAAVGPGDNWALIGAVPVYRLASPETIPYPLDANFADLIALRGFDASDRTPAPGQTLTLTLYWQALQPIPRSYTTFIHLLDADDNRVAQSDVVPGNGQWPTDTWKKGEWITDVVQLTLPSALPAGPYRLLVGMYRVDSGERLPVADDATGQNAVMLSPIQVQAR